MQAKVKSKRNERQRKRRLKINRREQHEGTQERRLEWYRQKMQEWLPANLTNHQRSVMNREARDFERNNSREV